MSPGLLLTDRSKDCACVTPEHDSEDVDTVRVKPAASSTIKAVAARDRHT